MGGRAKRGTCALCHRRSHLTFHHLIPRKVHRRNHFRQRYSSQELQRGIDICQLCHWGLHSLYDEMTLAKRLCTLEALLADEAVQRHIDWARKQKHQLLK